MASTGICGIPGTGSNPVSNPIMFNFFHKRISLPFAIIIIAVFVSFCSGLVISEYKKLAEIRYQDIEAGI